jgi:hypothetical protein
MAPSQVQAASTLLGTYDHYAYDAWGQYYDGSVVNCKINDGYGFVYSFSYDSGASLYKSYTVVKAHMWNAYLGSPIIKVRVDFDFCCASHWLTYYWVDGNAQPSYKIYILDWTTSTFHLLLSGSLNGVAKTGYVDINSDVSKYYYQESGYYGYTYATVRVDMYGSDIGGDCLFIDQLTAELFF